MVSLWYFNGIYMVFIWYLHRRQNEDTWDVVGKQRGKKISLPDKRVGRKYLNLFSIICIEQDECP